MNQSQSRMPNREELRRVSPCTTVNRSTLIHRTTGLRTHNPSFIAHSPLENFTSWFSNKPTETPAQAAEVSDGLDIHHFLSSTVAQVSSSPAAVASISAVSATGLTLLSVLVYRKYIRRIRNADYVTSGMIQERKWIKGVVTR
jgi:hypothetical protein